MGKPEMINNIRVFPSSVELAEAFARELVNTINEAAMGNRYLTIALSGGSTPMLLFSVLGEKYSDKCRWEKVHFFWGDERCVPPSDSDSNYKMVKESLFDKISIPSTNIHRIKGEAEPYYEAIRYSEEIRKFTKLRNSLPIFDIIILGMGDDGHTASIFPGKLDLLKSDKICEVATHPVSGQLRITLTCRVINNASSVIFLVTGGSKAGIVEAILNRKPVSAKYPASYVDPIGGKLTWLLDKEAYSQKNSKPKQKNIET